MAVRQAAVGIYSLSRVALDTGAVLIGTRRRCCGKDAQFGLIFVLIMV